MFVLVNASGHGAMTCNLAAQIGSRGERAAVIIGLCLLLAACGGTKGSSSMAIVECDPNGGSTPCASGGTGVDGARVDANPANVTSAKVILGSHGARTVRVLYQAAGGPLESTPTSEAIPEGQVLPLIGLKPSTSYAVQVLASDEAGALARSPVLSFTTPALPAEVALLATFKTTEDGDVAPGYIAISKLLKGGASVPQAAVVIDRAGNVVWYAEQEAAVFGDFQKQPDRTYTLAIADPDHYARYKRFDALGNELASYLSPEPGDSTDNHELRILPNGDALLLGLTTRTMDMSAYGGSATARVTGNSLYRIQPDGGVAFAWNSFDHTSPSDVDPGLAQLADNPLDETHCNSIDVTADGNYLVSSRHMSQVWKIDAKSGGMLWRLGRHGDFTFVNDPLDGFSGQHFARELAPDRILLFDDGNSHAPQVSRAVEYKLDPAARTATLVWSYTPSPPVFAAAMGSAQRLPNGNTLITYGFLSRIDEVDPQGNLVWQLTDDSPGVGIYRAILTDSLY